VKVEGRLRALIPLPSLAPAPRQGTVSKLVLMRSSEKLNRGNDWRSLAYGPIAAHTAVGSQLWGLRFDARRTDTAISGDKILIMGLAPLSERPSGATVQQDRSRWADGIQSHGARRREPLR
jgi:hypothetical protein